MFLLNFLRCLRGYVRFEARGESIEHFLNRTAQANISIWAGRWCSGVYQGCVAAHDYPRLRSHAKKSGVRLHLTDKRGLPFRRRRYRKRTGLLLGVTVFFLFLYGMSLFIWRIEISGNERVNDAAVLQALESLDIAPGTLRRSIDVRTCEQKLLLLLPDLSWAALNIDGSTIRVELSESTLPPEMIDTNLPCNVVAKYAGQITSMQVYDGQSMVQVGDTVLAGDILVSGIRQNSRFQSRYRHARAEILAKTTQTLEASVPLTQEKYVETGKTVQRRYLGIFSLELPLFLPLELPSPYSVTQEISPLTVFGTELPLSLTQQSYQLMEKQTVTYTEEEAQEEAERELSLLEQARLADAEILSQTTNSIWNGDTLLLRREYICILDIAQQREIPVRTTDTE